MVVYDDVEEVIIESTKFMKDTILVDSSLCHKEKLCKSTFFGMRSPDLIPTTSSYFA